MSRSSEAVNHICNISTRARSYDDPNIPPNWSALVLLQESSTILAKGIWESVANDSLITVPGE